MIRPALTRLAAATLLAAALGLAGCVTLFPKTTPAQLYRFDAKIAPHDAQGEPPVTVRAAPLAFDTESGGDQIMTVNGDQVAYIAGARWAAPAAELFEEALQHGFDDAHDVRLVSADHAAGAHYRLRLEVTRFEVRYDAGPAAAPTVLVRLRADLSREADLSAVGEQDFEASIPASDNRVGPIVAAFDQATSQVVGDLVSWVEKGGAS